jgi:DNA integrity scanning protein DisA with diadenylate cyclase activity
VTEKFEFKDDDLVVYPIFPLSWFLNHPDKAKELLHVTISNLRNGEFDYIRKKSQILENTAIDVIQGIENLNNTLEKCSKKLQNEESAQKHLKVLDIVSSIHKINHIQNLMNDILKEL